MKDVARELRAVVAQTLPRLRAFTDAEAGGARRPGAWSRREILGHLIDSAANNHQRVVRAPLQSSLVLPGYEQEAWVASQGYRERPWQSLVSLWELLNDHLAHAIARIPPGSVDTPCTIGGEAPVTLGFIARDYIRHMRHHLDQIFEDA